MLFLWKRCYYTNFYKSKKYSSLPDYLHARSLAAAMDTRNFLGRAALCTLQNQRGSLTIEAALVLPIFVFLCFCLLFFIQIFSLHGEIQGSLYQAAREVSETMPLLQGEEGTAVPGGQAGLNVLGTVTARQKVLEYAKEEIEQNHCLQGGSNGLQFVWSTVRDDMVDMVVSYKVKLPYAFGIQAAFPITQRCRIRAWTGISGKSRGDNAEEMVYITDSGTVYHRTAECTHLRLKIRLIDTQELDDSRNDNGGKYKPCEKCAKKGVVGNRIYVTSEGDRYHITISCSGLKRSVRQIARSKVSGRGACTRCYN